MTGHTILVVDDEPASLRTVARTLADEQRVVTVSSATQALDAIAGHAVALLIADQRMPEMSGTQLLARVAHQQPEIIRVLLTGYTDIDTLLDAINAGHVYHYLTKPWEPHELRLVVRRGLERYDADAERRQLLRDLEVAYARVQREADQKGRLLALATHELGTPLHVLSNALAFLIDADLPPPARVWLETAQRSAEWLRRGVGQMATASRWRASSLKLTLRPVDLGSLLDEVQTAFQTIVAARRLSLRVDVADGMPAVPADRMWLGRALGNLLSNAVRFTPDGGCITVTAWHVVDAVTITVADTGIGIEPHLLEDIFEAFSAAGGDVALHMSGRFEFGARGLGLGLAVAKAIVTQHGGTIRVCSEVGVGSQFTFTLPLQARSDLP